MEWKEIGSRCLSVYCPFQWSEKIYLYQVGKLFKIQYRISEASEITLYFIANNLEEVKQKVPKLLRETLEGTMLELDELEGLE